MLITRISGWHRPYYVTVNNKWYQVNTIKFYKDNEIIVSTISGWLEDKNGTDILNFELPIDEIALKRKEKFDGKVFIISKGKDWAGNDTLADLYIPADMVGVYFTRHEIKYRQLRAVYEGEQSIYISTVIKSLTDTLYSIRDEYEQMYKQLDDSSMSITRADIVFANIDKLKELAEKYKAEQERLSNLTIDDIEIETGE